jgi:tol-pal system protein YbgF
MILIPEKITYFVVAASVVLLLLLMLPLSASAEDRYDSYDGRDQYRRGAGLSPADMEVRIAQLEMEIRTLTGLLEQQSFEMRRVNIGNERLIADMEMRISDLERRLEASSLAGVSRKMGSGVPAGSNVSVTDEHGFSSLYRPNKANGGYVAIGAETSIESASVDEASIHMEGENGKPSTGKLLGTLVRKMPAVETSELESGDFDNGYGDRAPTDNPDNTKFTALTTNNPASAYEYAFTLLKGEDYSEAERAFSDFLDRYSDHSLASNAKYWLGETFYVRGDFERAARIFAEAYQQYPKSSKGPDNLLKLGMSLAGMGKSKDACTAFLQLKREYSNGAKPILVRAQQEMDKSGCH